MKTKNNGSSIDFIEKVKEIVKSENCPDVIEITTGNLFPSKEALSFKNDINEELKRRFPFYTIEDESDITVFAGMIKIKFTKIN